MVVFAVDIGRRMMELRGRAFNVDDALRWISGATPSTEWLGSRPGRDTVGVQVLNAIQTYATAPAFGLNSSPVLSIVCIITASFRAIATAALLNPILLRISQKRDSSFAN
jgi:hypothetical protein